VPSIGRVIVGASGSPGSLRALRYAEVLARAYEAPLVPVIAWEPPGGAQAGRFQFSDELTKDCHGIACRRLRDALVAVWGEVPDEPMVQAHVERGPAGWVLFNLLAVPVTCWSSAPAAAARWAGWPLPRWAATAWPVPNARCSPSRRPRWPENSGPAASRGCTGTGR
jgi:hypothetical protein